MKINFSIEVEDKNIVKILKAYGFSVETIVENKKYDPKIIGSEILITEQVPMSSIEIMIKNHLSHVIKNNFSTLLNDPEIRQKYENITDDIYFSDSKYLDRLVKIKY